MLNVLLLATTTAGAGTGTQGTLDPTMNSVLMLGFVVVLAVAMYFFTIRPQRKRDKELKNQVSKMTVGDQVVTIGGLVGTVANIKDDEITLTTSVAHTMVTFKKSAISTIIPRESK